MISFKGEFVIFAAKLKDDSLLLKERLLSHNGEFVSIKGWKNNGGNVVFNGWIVIEPDRGGKGVAEHQTIDVLYSCQVKTFFFCTKLLSMHFCTGELFEEDLLLLMPMTPQSSRV